MVKPLWTICIWCDHSGLWYSVEIFFKKTIFKNILQIPINASGQISDCCCSGSISPPLPSIFLPYPPSQLLAWLLTRSKKKKAWLPIYLVNEGRKSSDRTGIFTAVFSCSFTNREKQESRKKQFFKHGTYSRCGTPFIGDMVCPTWNK